MDEAIEKMSSNLESASLVTLTKHYRIGIACEKLVLQCCNQNWLTTVIWVIGYWLQHNLLFEDLRVALVHCYYREAYIH
jgi:hypothetical protein